MRNMHHMLSILKVSITEQNLETIHWAQRVCGQYGNQQCSGFSLLRHICESLVQVDVNNTNILLHQAKTLFRMNEMVHRKKEKLPEPFDYIQKSELYKLIQNRGTNLE